MKPLVIYHDSCADGFGAAFAAWLKLGDEAEYVPMQYGHPAIDSMTGKDREVYILDFSLPKPQMEQLFRVAQRVVWLDHHASVFKDWSIPLDVVGDNQYFSIEDMAHHIVLDNNKSGAILAWEHFHPGTEAPLLLRHIDDYDRWQFKLEGTKELNAALWTSLWNFPQWKELLLSDLVPMYKAGKAILLAHEQNVAAVVKGSARKCTISTCCPQHGPDIADSVPASWSDGYLRRFDGLAANCPPHLASDVGHELAKQSGTFGLLWFIDKDNTCRCSLRSNGDYDVSAIAKAFGGGGHRNAAGFTTDVQTLLGWTE